MIAPHPEQLAGTVGARAIAEFGINVSRFHWDVTSMSVHGACVGEEQDAQFPVIKYRHPKDRRTDLKQIQAGIAATGDGRTPARPRLRQRGVCLALLVFCLIGRQVRQAPLAPNLNRGPGT
ncbi:MULTISPECIES: hypothetical protein [unclassified Streptomyces]|uniref:hypothetical protein n=1 Tax=unclassified Streptomyces TaxID=2593676 RepID=UPI00336A6125